MTSDFVEELKRRAAELRRTIVYPEPGDPRIRQAADVGAGTLVSACQQCERTLANAARAERIRVRVKDITEVVLDAVEN